MMSDFEDVEYEDIFHHKVFCEREVELWPLAP
jgi:hypothetical protein